MTQHCRLEAVGVVPQQCEQAGEQVCDSDGCSVLEDGAYKLGTATLTVAEPRLQPPLFVVALPVNLLAGTVAVDRTKDEISRPLNWVPSWQFVRRAAPPSRAPALSLA